MSNLAINIHFAQISYARKVHRSSIYVKPWVVCVNRYQICLVYIAGYFHLKIQNKQKINYWSELTSTIKQMANLQTPLAREDLVVEDHCTFFFIRNSIFHLNLRLLREDVHFRLKVAKKLPTRQQASLSC